MSKIERLRQTGKTTRIANFVIDQLFSVGAVVVTDHTSFEFPTDDNASSIENLIEKVYKLIEATSFGNVKIEHMITKSNNVKLIWFKTIESYE
jgi:hypothetical protein